MSFSITNTIAFLSNFRFSIGDGEKGISLCMKYTVIGGGLSPGSDPGAKGHHTSRWSSRKQDWKHHLDHGKIRIIQFSKDESISTETEYRQDRGSIRSPLHLIDRQAFAVPGYLNLLLAQVFKDACLPIFSSASKSVLNVPFPFQMSPMVLIACACTAYLFNM